MAQQYVKDRETISSVSSSIGFTAAKLTSYLIYAIVQAVSGSIRFTIDGTAPTTSLGLRLTEDSKVEVWGGQALKNFRCIDDGSTATVEVVYMDRAG